jgi:hypothetical protein
MLGDGEGFRQPPDQLLPKQRQSGYYRNRRMVPIPASLLEHILGCLERDPEIWRSKDGGCRVLGPISTTYSFLHVMVFEGAPRRGAPRGLRAPRSG